MERTLPPKVAAIHSMAGFGRCSLTVIIPVLSAMGAQVCPLPTAILSTHSGGFGEMSFHDLTGSMRGYAGHWREVGINFDAIYSGFLGSAEQIDIVAQFIDDFGGRPGQHVVVDPVMADGGKLYRTYTTEMRDQMGRLAAKANIITPNLTEACFLLGLPYVDQPLPETEVRGLLVRLANLGPDIVVIKSVPTQDGRHANVALDRVSGSFCSVPFVRVPVNYPGTGDIFAAVLLGGLLAGDDLVMSMTRATEFLSDAVRVTRQYRTPEREGVLLERVLPHLRRSPARRSDPGGLHH